MSNFWNQVFYLLEDLEYDNANLRIILRRMNHIIGRNSFVPYERIKILQEMKSVLRKINDKEEKEGVGVLLNTIKCMLHSVCFPVDSLNQLLRDYHIPYQYILTDFSDIFSGQFEKENMYMTKDKNAKRKLNKIFISHSTRDKEYARAFVTLLEDIGLEKEMIFCSSIDPYGVPLNKNIYEFIRDEFIHNNPYVFFLLSHKYYESFASQNEMGAVWIVKSGYTSFLLPGFEYKDIEGAIDASRIGIKLDGDDEELRNRLISLRDFLLDGFDLKRIDEKVWNRKLNEFIHRIHKNVN